MEMNRRDWCVAMAAFASLGGLMGKAQETKGSAADTTDMAVSKVFRYDEMKVSHYANGGWGRAVMHGTLPTGEFVEVHETMLPAGQMPHPPHRHRNTEFVLIRQGKLEFLNDGKPEPAGMGDVIYTASNQMHGLKNVGDAPALYFVVSVSHGQM
ncbi:MAG: cupin domain-containing protein [Acidobacteriaceae bacterium]